MACATLKRSLEFDPVHSHGRPSKRRRCIPMSVSPSAHSSSCSVQSSPTSNSPFDEATNKLTSEKISANLREEIHRLNKRKQLQFTSQNDSSDMETPSSPSSPSFSSNYNFNSSTKEKPLFTFRQVSLICERMIKERELQIKEEYDQILSMKLSEQYDTFVKFTYDQIQKRFESSAAPSYLS